MASEKVNFSSGARAGKEAPTAKPAAITVNGRAFTAADIEKLLASQAEG